MSIAVRTCYGICIMYTMGITSKMSLVKKTNYAELVGLCGIRPIMHGSAPIMCKIMRAHNRIIPLLVCYALIIMGIFHACIPCISDLDDHIHTNVVYLLT